MLPDGEPIWENGGWDARPHEPSYQMALVVVQEVDALKGEAVEFLARIVDFEKLAMEGEPFAFTATRERKRLSRSWSGRRSWSAAFR